MKRFVTVLSLAIVVSLASVATVFADHSHGYQKASEAYAAGDYKTAFHLWSEEAESGAGEAQEMLGAMYAAGKGTAQDYVAAVKWYRMAAEKGQVSAQYALGNFYAAGQGVAKNKEYAYAWWLIAASNDSKTSKTRWSDIKEEMTPEEIERAHDKVLEILFVLAD